MSRENILADKPYFSCKHEKKVTFGTQSNCQNCGVLILSNDKVYKSEQMNYGAFFNPQSLIKKALKIRQDVIIVKDDTDYFKQRSQLVEYMWDIATKLKLTINTIHLSIYFMDVICNKINVNKQQLELYASTCVMLAAKTVELDERIPFISKLRKYSGLYNTTQEFSRAEATAIKNLNWNLQCVTLIDVLEIYLSQAFIFASDFYEQNNDGGLKERKLNIQVQDEDPPIQVQNMADNQIIVPIQRIEKEYMRLCNILIRETHFYKYLLNVLAASTMAYLRQISGISPTWNKHLSNLFLIEPEEFQDCLYDLQTKYSCIFINKKPQKTFNTQTSVSNENQVIPQFQRKYSSNQIEQKDVFQYKIEQQKPMNMTYKNEIYGHTNSNSFTSNIQNVQYFRKQSQISIYQHPNTNSVGFYKCGSNIY